MIAELKSQNQLLSLKIDQTIASLNASHHNELDELGERLRQTQQALDSSDSNAEKIASDLQGQLKSGRA